jgi:hypothetical protein
LLAKLPLWPPAAAKWALPPPLGPRTPLPGNEALPAKGAARLHRSLTTLCHIPNLILLDTKFPRQIFYFAKLVLPIRGHFIGLGPHIFSM